MANDMNSAMDALKGLLGDNADEKLQSVMNSLSGQSSTPSSGDNISNALQGGGGNNMEYLLKMKNIIDEMSHDNDPRTNLLMSLRPYMRDSRKGSIDGALRILSLTKFSGLFNGFLKK